jgi:xylulokinase
MNESTLLVGVDMGSTNVKAVIYEPDGRTVAHASVPTTTHVPRPTWAYYDPRELWDKAVEVLHAATAQLDDPRRIAGIAITSVGEAGVPIDKDGNPTYDAIAWFDRRTIPQRDRLEREIGEDAISARSGLSLMHIYSLCKLMWLQENEPEVWAKSVTWLHVADYIVFKLCGAKATDYSLASRTLVFNLARRDWDDDILAGAGIPRAILAPTVQSGTPLGAVTPDAAAVTGLPAGTVVAAGGHDHVCGAFAAGVVKPGQMLDSMGTAEALFLALDTPLTDPQVAHRGYSQGAHVAAGHYYVLGGLHSAGASVEWLRGVVGGIDHETMIAEAATAPAGSMGALFLPHLRSSNPPHPDSRGRAAFVGVTSDVTRGTLARAVLEGLAYEARASLEPLLAFAGLDAIPQTTAIGGGSKNELLLDIKASVINAPIRVLEVEEATALGAAMLGGLGAGVYRDVDDAVAAIRSQAHDVAPVPDAVPVYDQYFRDVYQHLYDTLRPLNQRIHPLATGESTTERTP